MSAAKDRLREAATGTEKVAEIESILRQGSRAASNTARRESFRLTIRRFAAACIYPMASLDAGDASVPRYSAVATRGT